MFDAVLEIEQRALETRLRAENLAAEARDAIGFDGPDVSSLLFRLANVELKQAEFLDKLVDAVKEKRNG